MTSLNPVQRIGNQITEPLRSTSKLSKAGPRRPPCPSSCRSGSPRPVERYEAYPHQLSGGMRRTS